MEVEVWGHFRPFQVNQGEVGKIADLNSPTVQAKGLCSLAGRHFKNLPCRERRAITEVVFL